MKKEDLYRAINEIDDSYIIDAQRFPGRKPPTIRRIVIRCMIVLLVLAVILFVPKFKRISFDNETLGSNYSQYISEDTSVICLIDHQFPTELPIYKITERKISREELRQIQQIETPVFTADWHGLVLDGNRIDGYFSDYGTGLFTMSEEELETLSWNVFNQIPFMDGEYVYSGIRGEESIWSSDKGTQRTRVLVSFYRKLDGIRVVGVEQCDFWFNDNGLVELHIAFYDYERIGTMNLVSFDDAQKRIKSPDYFSSGSTGIAHTLQVDEVALLYVNQYSRGCTILQPVYSFSGTTTLGDGRQGTFKAKIIAIPEYYTYEDPFDR